MSVTVTSVPLVDEVTVDPSAGVTVTVVEVPGGPGGGGAVDSVNGETGAVVLTAADVGALPADDPSVTNARTPTAHHISHESGGTDVLALAQSQVTGLVAALAAKLNSTDLATAVLALALSDFPAGLARDTEVTNAVADEATARDAAIATAVGNLLAGAPAALDTLDELAAALGDDASFAANLTTTLAGKQPLNSNLTSIAALTTTAYGRSLLEAANAGGLRTLAGLVLGTDIYSKAAVDSGFAPLASPALTGNPTAPTPSAADNDTSIATTAFVTAAVAAGGGGSAAPLAVTNYNPGTAATKTTTSVFSTGSPAGEGGYVDVDATNLAVTFTVPASGQVLVRATAVIQTSGSMVQVWALREGSTTLAGTGCSMMRGTNSIQLSKAWLITGLTPGASLTYKLAYAVSSAGTASLFAGGGNSNPNGSATLEVWAA